MDSGNKRRIRVLEMIKENQNALSASFIARVVGVSRQVIVGDVALLRAEGHQIIATARGYMIGGGVNNKYVRKIACQHRPEQTKDELYLLVDLGVRVEDVVIEHEVYGELTGSLGLETRIDVDLFIQRFEKAGVKLLSELTQGIHLHTVSCRSKEHFDEVMIAMENAGFLVSGIG
jgi:transcriptional regulator of NAD metabolism